MPAVAGGDGRRCRGVAGGEGTLHSATCVFVRVPACQYSTEVLSHSGLWSCVVALLWMFVSEPLGAGVAAVVWGEGEVVMGVRGEVVMGVRGEVVMGVRGEVVMGVRGEAGMLWEGPLE